MSSEVQIILTWLEPKELQETVGKKNSKLFNAT